MVLGMIRLEKYSNFMGSLTMGKHLDFTRDGFELLGVVSKLHKTQCK